MPRIALLSTSYLRHKNDLSGVFIHNIIDRICKTTNDFEFEIVMPAEEGYPKVETWGKIKLNRFQYFIPFDKQKLATDSGIPTDLRKSWLAKLQLPFFMLSFLFTTIKVSRNCDIIHAHFFPCGLIALVAGILVRKKVILTLHGTDYRMLKPFTSSKILKYIMCKFNKIIILGQDANSLLNNIGLPESKILKSRIAVDERIFSPTKKRDSDQLNLLWVGRVVPVKNLDLLLETINELNNKNIHLKIVGNGSEKERLKIYSQTHPNLKNVSWVDQMPNNHLVQLYQEADFFILTSNNEGLPATMLEAMSCGTPVISTKVGSIPEIIKNDQNGYLFDTGNKTQLLTLLRKLANKEFKKDTLFNNSRETVENNFSLEKISQQTENFYRTI